MSTEKRSGFTIIEVVLVLAVAGIIFAMVLIAVPQLQRNNRDAQRRQDLARIGGQIQVYSTQNRQAIPKASNLVSFQTKYLQPADEYTDPRGEPYSIKGKAVGVGGSVNGLEAGDGQVFYVEGRTCGLDGTVAEGNKRDYALFVALESSKVPECFDGK